MSLIALLVHTAQAGPTLGLGIGGVVTLGEDRAAVGAGFPHENCVDLADYGAERQGENVIVGTGRGDGMNTCQDIKAGAGFGGRLSVPVRFHLTPTAMLRVSADIEVSTVSNGSHVEYAIDYDNGNQPQHLWVRDEATYRHLGVRSISGGLRLLVGPEFALKPEGTTPYFGASVGAVAQYTYNGLGYNANLKGWETSPAIDYRETNGACSDINSGSCVDISAMNLVPTAEIHGGYMNRGEGLPFFVEAGYAVALVPGATKRWRPDEDRGVTPGVATVKVLPYHLRPISVSAGLLFEL